MAFPFLLCFSFVWLKTDLPREITVSGWEKSHLRKNVFTNPKQKSLPPPLCLSFFFFLYVQLIARSKMREKRDCDYNPPYDVRADKQEKIQRVSCRSLSVAVCFWITTGLAGVVSGISVEANISAKCWMDCECQKARLNESLAAALWQLSVIRN